MQSLDDRLRADLTGAMRARDEVTTTTLRMALAALHARAIEKKGKGGDPQLSDEEALQVISKEVKKRHEAAEAFSTGARPELAEKERREAAVLAAYLPARATEEEVRTAVEAAVRQVNPSSMKDFGSVVREALAALRGTADGAAVSVEAKRQLASQFGE